MSDQPSDGIHILESYRPTNPPITNGQDNRNALNYLTVLRQFDVENNPRYTPNHAGHGETYCNIFLWDATKAMGAEIPHWVESDGEPSVIGKGHELNANAVCDWLMEEGFHYGWTLCSVDDALQNALLGRPTVVVWKNPGGIGHVAMVIPQDPYTTQQAVQPGEQATPNHVLIAQAGGHNYFSVDVTRGFGNRALLYFKHA